MKTRTLILLITSLFIGVINNTFAVDPVKTDVLKPKPPLSKEKAIPKQHLKPDLMIQDMGFSQEFCRSGCGEWGRDLQAERIDERCAWNVTVKNIGTASSRPGRVQLDYDSLGGHVTQVANMPAVSPGAATVVRVPLHTADRKKLYRRFSSAFEVKVDATNTTSESNEGNNTKSLRLPSAS